MPLHQSDSIILKTYPLGEADRIVVFFSRDFGKVRGVANGARRMKNRFGASLEPLAHSRLMFFEKENRELVRIQSAELLDSPMGLFADYDRAVFAAQLVELLDKFLPEHEPHDAVYRLARMTLEAIERNCPLNAAACYFEVWMLRLAGMFPDLFHVFGLHAVHRSRGRPASGAGTAGRGLQQLRASRRRCSSSGSAGGASLGFAESPRR